MVEANNDLTIDEATQIYYDSKEYQTATPTYQYESNYLVATDEEYKKLPNIYT